MSRLFQPAKIGNLELSNRFVHSATYECMAGDDGSVSGELIRRYRNLTKGEVGLVIPGHIYVHPRGKAFIRQIAIDADEMIPGLGKLARAVHDQGGRIAFQLAHGGRQAPKAVSGRKPLAPSGWGRDPASLNKPRAMTEDDIAEVIQAFALAAARAKEAGADAVQIHAAHGYLLSEFLSPFFNRRTGGYGGSDENRFRLLREVYLEVRQAVGPDMPVLVKLNGNDFTPKPGVTPALAARYAGWLAELGIDAVEISAGTYFTFHTMRGDLPISDLTRSLPFWMRPAAKMIFKKQVEPCAFKPLFNQQAAGAVKRVIGQTPLMMVGGVRRLDEMEQALDQGPADFISLSRPLIREPFLVKRMKEGKTEKAACISCNRCFAAVFNRLPLKCYVDGLPQGGKK